MCDPTGSCRHRYVYMCATPLAAAGTGASHPHSPLQPAQVLTDTCIKRERLVYPWAMSASPVPGYYICMGMQELNGTLRLVAIHQCMDVSSSHTRLLRGCLCTQTHTHIDTRVCRRIRKTILAPHPQFWCSTNQWVAIASALHVLFSMHSSAHSGRLHSTLAWVRQA